MTPAVVSVEEWRGRENNEEECKEDGMCGIYMILLILFTGEPLSWGERCRIKHLPTRKYLAVIHPEGEYKV